MCALIEKYDVVSVLYPFMGDILIHLIRYDDLSKKTSELHVRKDMDLCPEKSLSLVYINLGLHFDNSPLKRRLCNFECLDLQEVCRYNISFSYMFVYFVNLTNTMFYQLKAYVLTHKISFYWF